MGRLRAEFSDPESAAAAVDALAAAGVDPRAMELYSRRPLERYPDALRRKSFLSLGAVAGAIAAGGGATALMAWIQRDYPLNTGGMPIVSGWSTGVVSLEMALAGAVLGICVMLLWESGLLSGGGEADPEGLPERGAVLLVSCSRREAAVALPLLEELGAAPRAGAPPADVPGTDNLY